MEPVTDETSAASIDQNGGEAPADQAHSLDSAGASDEHTATPSENSKVPVSCTKAFDSLYYCYSPFYQGRHYYITGELDNCRGRLRRFRMCVLSRFRRQSDSELMYEEDELKEKRAKGLENVEPVWQLREEFLAAVERAEQEERDAGQDHEGDSKKDKWWL